MCGDYRNQPGHIYFARHGQTTWNVENKICGSKDVELTPDGHAQANELGLKILKEELKIDRILYSPLKRARDTAQHVHDITGIPIEECSSLTEQSFGVWEGKDKRSVEFLHEKEKFACSYQGGESMLHLAQRVYNLLDTLKAESGDRTSLIIAHNGIARVVHSYFYDMTNEEFAGFKIQNCEIRQYDFH